MKKIIITTLVLISLNGFSQKDSNLVLKRIYDGYKITDDGVFRFKLDTVKVVMLLSDTSSTKYSSDCGTCLHFGYNYFTYWQFGYLVRERVDYNKSYWNGIELKNGNEYNEWKWILYLDENKKPLSKNILVWMDIPLK